MFPPTLPKSAVLSYQGKRASKGLPEPILPDPLITVLIGELDILVCAIVKYTSVIQRYYIEYLKGAHLTSLRRLIQVRAVSGMRRGDTWLKTCSSPVVSGDFVFCSVLVARGSAKA